MNRQEQKKRFVSSSNVERKSQEMIEANRIQQKQTVSDKNRLEPTRTDRNRQEQIGTDINSQNQEAVTDRHRQEQAGTDRNRQEQTGTESSCHPATNPNITLLLFSLSQSAHFLKKGGIVHNVYTLYKKALPVTFDQLACCCFHCVQCLIILHDVSFIAYNAKI